jgi:hypothetical protein
MTLSPIGATGFVDWKILADGRLKKPDNIA